jgi:hypothetical protein
MKTEGPLAKYLSERKMFQRKVVEKDVLHNVVGLRNIIKASFEAH